MPAALCWALAALLPGSARADPVALDRLPEAAATISLPESSRGEIPSKIPITGPWRVVYSTRGVRTWEAPLPVRTRTLFFHRAPGDMAVFASGRKLQHASGMHRSDQPGTWSFTSHALQVRRPIAAGPPAPGEYALRYKEAVVREASLNADRSNLSAHDFVVRSLQLDDTTRHGLFLPAPASISFSVTVPPAGVLDLTPMLLPPEAADPVQTSSGARLLVRVAEQVVDSFALTTGDHPRERVDLSDWSGQTVQLELLTDPLGDPTLDYVFVADPVVHTPQDDPQRVVIIFIDTLRTDHMSLYGYDRQTTPHIDAWAEGGLVFEQARSVAPWTLPSTRAMVTGAVPECWGSQPTLQERLATAGWATTFIAGNIYLSSNFEMADGWGEHRCTNWPLAGVQVDRALDFLDQHEDQPVLMMLHFMDMHLPYTEPPSYRYTFAGAAPDALPRYEFHRSEVLKAVRKMGEEGKQYIRDRYDNNLRYIDDSLGRFLSVLDDDDLVILLADHGEEFWDHDDFEHGHTLYDELLHVPMIVRGPGFSAGRTDVPVSLLDVAPTIAAALGLPAPEMTGWPLQGIADGSRVAEFRARPQAFGRPLYGSSAWGSLLQGEKYITRDGRESLYDVRDDPGEQADQWKAGRSPEAGRAALAAALRTTTRIGFRLIANSDSRGGDAVATLSVPGGVDDAWVAEDPTKSSAAEVRIAADGTVTATWKGGYRKSREIFVVPSRPAEEVAAELTMQLTVGRAVKDAQQGRREWPPHMDGTGQALWRASTGKRNVSLSFAVVPLPGECRIELDATSIENCAELLALGYVESCP